MLTCAGCRSTDIETDQARGNSICKRCGMVVEDSLITSEVTFMESSSGANSVLGQYVSAEGSKPFTSMTSANGYPQFSRDSRTLTLQSGRKSIQQLAPSLALTQRHVEMAHRYFRMAMEYRFIQGRKTNHVVAACLYIVVRLEKLPLMLLDFADQLQVNVFTLGATYLKLCQTLKINQTFKDALPTIDPVLYLDRFAHKLEFGNKTQEVYQTAVRLVSRMNRDWIQVGRRPAGLCGAGLLIAARLHGFSRTQKEVVNVVRICESTLRKRLDEFEETPSSELTLQQFKQIDLEGEADPPAFTQARERARLALRDSQAAAAAAAAAAASGSELDAETMSAAEKELQSLCQTQEFVELDNQANTDAGVSPSAAASATAAAAAAATTDAPSSHPGVAACTPSATAAAAAATALPSNEATASATAAPTTKPSKPAPRPRHLSGHPISGLWNAPELDDPLAGFSDSELEQEYQMTERERRAKEKVWMEDNREYLSKQAAKEEQAAKDRAAGITKAPAKKRKRKSHRQTEPAGSAEEAMQQMLEYKKSRISSKINYDVLKGLGFEQEEDSKKGIDMGDVAEVDGSPAEQCAEAGSASAAAREDAPAAVAASSSAATGSTMGGDPSSTLATVMEEDEDSYVQAPEDDDQDTPMPSAAEELRARFGSALQQADDYDDDGFDDIDDL
eukprot:m.244529 g.244529  ORF g.244529 m.244529 type:complete len:677 (+) comp19038_c2_seq3:216-2246(+)